MIAKGWVAEAANQIINALTPDISQDRVAAIIVVNCPVPRCETCKYWSVQQRQTLFLDQMPPTNRVCNLPYTTGSKMNADMYDAIITEPDFGCVQWESKT